MVLELFSTKKTHKMRLFKISNLRIDYWEASKCVFIVFSGKKENVSSLVSHFGLSLPYDWTFKRMELGKEYAKQFRCASYDEDWRNCRFLASRTAEIGWSQIVDVGPIDSNCFSRVFWMLRGTLKTKKLSLPCELIWAILKFQMIVIAHITAEIHERRKSISFSKSLPNLVEDIGNSKPGSMRCSD